MSRHTLGHCVAIIAVVMASAMLWADARTEPQSDGRTGRRLVGLRWDPTLPAPDALARSAMRETGGRNGTAATPGARCNYLVAAMPLRQTP